jgi:uncharacterized protein YkuJ
MDAEKVLLKIVNIFNVYGIVIIIRERLHIIKNDPVYDEDGKAEYEFTRNGRQVVGTVEDQHQYNLVNLKIYQES